MSTSKIQSFWLRPALRRSTKSAHGQDCVNAHNMELYIQGVA
jgi:hypothetical protein